LSYRNVRIAQFWARLSKNAKFCGEKRERKLVNGPFATAVFLSAWAIFFKDLQLVYTVLQLKSPPSAAPNTFARKK
jgi:hypothetical protein